MEDKEVIRLIGQFLHEHGYTQALEALSSERYQGTGIALFQ